MKLFAITLLSVTIVAGSTLNLLSGLQFSQQIEHAAQHMMRFKVEPGRDYDEAVLNHVTQVLESIVNKKHVGLIDSLLPLALHSLANDLKRGAPRLLSSMSVLRIQAILFRINLHVDSRWPELNVLANGILQIQQSSHDQYLYSDAIEENWHNQYKVENRFDESVTFDHLVSYSKAAAKACATQLSSSFLGDTYTPDESINKLEMMLAIYEPDLKVLRLDCEPDVMSQDLTWKWKHKISTFWGVVLASASKDIFQHQQRLSELFALKFLVDSVGPDQYELTVLQLIWQRKHR